MFPCLAWDGVVREERVQERDHAAVIGVATGGLEDGTAFAYSPIQVAR